MLRCWGNSDLTLERYVFGFKVTISTDRATHTLFGICCEPWLNHSLRQILNQVYQHVLSSGIKLYTGDVNAGSISGLVWISKIQM